MTLTPAAFDVETSIVDDTSGAWRDGTRVVLAGVQFYSENAHTPPGSNYMGTDLRAWDLLHAASTVGPTLICGHNLAFDLCHVLKARGDMAIRWLLSPNVGLWDTQIADYLMEGCGVSWQTLEESGARSGVKIEKDPWASDAFKRGIGADVLYAEDPARLRRYLDSDLVGTLQLALKQRQTLENKLPGMRRVVLTQMRALKLVVLCQHFGMPVHKPTLEAAAQANEKALEEKNTALAAALDALVTHPIARAQFNHNSPAQLTALLFGGNVVYTERVENGAWKTGKRAGQPRYKCVEHAVTFPALISDTDGRSTAEATLLYALAQTETPETARAVISALMAQRELHKLATTYYRPIAKKILVSKDGRLHGDFNMAVTNTGRKSSSDPNLQNIPDSVRESIQARDGYVIMAGDGKQLEVVGLGYMSRCPKLRAALQAKKDIHGIVKAGADARTGLDNKRTDVKRVVFGRFYGGGAKTLSAQSGIPVEVVKVILEELDAAFPTAAAFYKKVRRALTQNRYSVPGGPDESYYVLPSGRRLRFVAGDDGEFKYTEMKNRPIQSFATADVIPFAEQCLVAWFAQDVTRLTEQRVIPLAMVHDELVLEVRKDAIEEARGFFRTLSKRIVPALNEWYALDPPLDLPLDISVGTGHSWAAAKESGEVIEWA